MHACTRLIPVGCVGGGVSCGHCHVCSVHGGTFVQARLVFAMTATLGVRTTFFQFWRWLDCEIVKVPMRNGEVVRDTDDISMDDPTVEVRDDRP